MKLCDIVEKVGFLRCGEGATPEREVTGGIVCDLLSVVVSKAARGGLWLTVQCHPNIVAVAAMCGLAGIVVVHGFEPDAETLARASQEEIAIFTTSLSAFEAAGRLYVLGVGRR